MTQKLAIFDIDGTLHKTEIMSIETYKVIMPKLGLPVPDEKTLHSTFGCNSEELMDILEIEISDRERFLNSLQNEEVVQMYRVSECYDGILDMLHELNDLGIAIGVCSMCKPPYMDAFLKRFALENVVKYHRNESDGMQKDMLVRQLLDESSPEDVVMIGDRLFDIDAARQNGIASIGCLYGYAPQEARAADFVVKDPFELNGVIFNLLEASA
jgi:phosphoglycolate phosphatase